MSEKIVINYVVNARLPTEKAHGIQIIKMCEALSMLGIDLNLIIPRRIQVNNKLGNNLFNYYGVKKKFHVQFIWNIDLLPRFQGLQGNGSIAFLIQDLTFSLVSLFYVEKKSILYTRSKLVAALNLSLKRKVVFEAHDSANDKLLDKFISRQAFIIVCISESIERSWKKFKANTFYLPDGVGEEFFIHVNKAQARKKLKLSLNKKIILYTGNLYEWKGVDTLAKAANKLSDYLFYFVGGSVIDKNIEPFKEKTRGIRNLEIVGHRSYSQIPLWLKAADVLVLPNSGKTIKSREDTSPLKLFEYMASGRTIVASRVPAVTEILNKNEAFFFQPDDYKDLVIKLREALKVKDMEQNSKKAREFTWTVRAKKILEKLQ